MTNEVLNKSKCIIGVGVISLIVSLMAFNIIEGNITRITIHTAEANYLTGEVRSIRGDREVKSGKITETRGVSEQEHRSGGDSSDIGGKENGSIVNVESVAKISGLEKLINVGINEEVAQAMMSPQYKYIDPKYYAVIALAENGRNPRAVGDGGCSNGPYQFNKCAGDRKKQIWFGESFEECSKDYICATKMLHDKIIGAYKCDVQIDGSIPNWENCLSKHQGFTYDNWYKNKIVKNHKILFGI